MKYRLTNHTSLTNIDGDAVLLDMQEGQYFGLNHVGADYLNLINNSKDDNQAVIEIAQTYAIDYNQVRDDINGLIKQLLEQKLLETIEE